MYLDPRLHQYFDKVAKDFACTAFGTFYLANKVKVDELVASVEERMKMYEDLDDTSFLISLSNSTGQYQQLLT